MTHPASSETFVRIGMATLTGSSEVRLHDARMFVGGGQDQVGAMTVTTDGFVGNRARLSVFKDLYGCTMKIGDIGFEDVSGDAILGHQVAVSMAFSAKVWGIESKLG